MKLLRNILVRTVLLFGIVIGGQEIALGQSTTQDSCICYTDKQDKNCLECLINKSKKDSLIINKGKEIDLLESQIREFKEQKNISRVEIGDLRDNLYKTKKRLDLSLSLNKFGIPIGIGGGILIGIMIK